MTRPLRWGLAALVALGLLLAGVVLLPLQTWLPGGTVDQRPTAEVVNGTAFNRLFPPPEAGQQVVFSQEKRGFSEAKLKQGVTTLALMAISDTVTAPEARQKFETSGQELQGWPLVEQGEQASALLVAQRFQVKVIGQGTGLDAAQRHDLIGAFDLRGLAALNPAVVDRHPKALGTDPEQPQRLPMPGSHRAETVPQSPSRPGILEPQR